jgi:hypothetical protein
VPRETYTVPVLERCDSAARLVGNAARGGCADASTKNSALRKTSSNQSGIEASTVPSSATCREYLYGCLINRSREIFV